MKKEYLIEIDELRKDKSCDAYFKWKDLNTYIKGLVSRGLNIPDAITEPLGCYCLDYLWNKSSGGDALTKDGKIVEFKATSNYNSDLSSFGPNTNFDKLIFLRFDLDFDTLHIYDLNLNSEDLSHIKTSKNETFLESQNKGKRPRFSIINKIIEPNNLNPIITFNLRKGKIDNIIVK